MFFMRGNIVVGVTIRVQRPNRFAASGSKVYESRRMSSCIDDLETTLSIISIRRH